MDLLARVWKRSEMPHQWKLSSSRHRRNGVPFPCLLRSWPEKRCRGVLPNCNLFECTPGWCKTRKSCSSNRHHTWPDWYELAGSCKQKFENGDLRRQRRQEHWGRRGLRTSCWWMERWLFSGEFWKMISTALGYSPIVKDGRTWCWRWSSWEMLRLLMCGLASRSRFLYVFE